MVLVGVGTVAYVLIAATGTREDAYDPWVTLNVADYAPGEWRRVELSGEPYIVHRLTGEDLRRAASVPLHVSDGQTVEARVTMVPIEAGTAFAPFAIHRAIDNRNFCMVSRVRNGMDGAAWMDPCHGSRFDALGRRLKGPALELPRPRTRLRDGELQVATDEMLRRSAG